MSAERVEVGYICHKGGGHFLLDGNSGYGVCGSHVSGRIYMEAEPGQKIDLTAMAEQLRDWVEDAERAINEQQRAAR